VVAELFLEEAATIAVDVETTSVDAHSADGRVRLIQLTAGDETLVVDAFAIDPSPLWPVLEGKTLVAHNASFEAAWLARLGLDVTRCAWKDTMILSSLLRAGLLPPGNSLEEVTERHLKMRLDKSHQKGDWSGELTSSQVDYAATDAIVTRDVLPILEEHIDAAGLRATADLEERCLKAVAWMSRVGVGFDKEAWTLLAQKAEQEAQTLRQQLDEQAPAKPLDPPKTKKSRTKPKPDEHLWNWNSNQQIKKVFALLGVKLPNTQEETVKGVDHPLARLLVTYKGVHKLASTYGMTWLGHVGPDGRLRCKWGQCGARTGRMSSSDHNLQNLPRLGAYRRCFVAPPGRVLIKFDYSQIELRLCARIANATSMINAFLSGQDLHTRTAQAMTGRTEITKEERAAAKTVNFGLIYGLSPKALAAKSKADYGIDMTLQEAEQYRRQWFAMWPEIAHWHAELKRQVWRGGDMEVRTLLGRRILIPKKNNPWYGKMANYAVQGTGGDGLKAALALLWERRADCPDAFPVLAVHDEFVIECSEKKVAEVTAWVRSAMMDGMQPFLDDVPCEIETSVGKTWGG
jgi:DNA polymerase-1